MSVELKPPMMKPDHQRVSVLAGILAAHIGLIVLFMMSPALHPASPDKDKPPIQLPVPLQMAMVELMQTPAPMPAKPLPVGQPMAKPQVTPTPAPATPVKRESKPVVTSQAAVPKIATKSESGPVNNAPVVSPVAAASERGITDATASSASTTSGRQSSASDATASQTTASASTQGASGSGSSSSPPRFGAAYLNNPAPKYPTMAKRLGDEGRVLLRVLVSPDGLAKEVRIHASSGSSLLDDSALKAVRRWRFIPAKQGSASVEAWVQVPIVFKLD